MLLANCSPHSVGGGKMLQKSMLTFLLPLLGLLFPTYLGTHLQHINLSPSSLPILSSFSRELSAERGKNVNRATLFSPSTVEDQRVSFAVSISPSVVNRRQRFRYPLDSSAVPVASPASHGPVASPIRSPWHRGRHHRHTARGRSISPFPSKSPGCGQICAEPFTSAPFGSTCGCVLPMKIRLILDVSLYSFFPLVNQLEIEIADAIYLDQKQVVIVGAKAESQDQDKSVVDVNLVSFEERFDNTTALLIYERFWQKKVALNSSLFGNYRVIHIIYPGLPSSPPSGESTGEGPSGSRGDQQFPITAYVNEKNQKFSPRIVLVISLSVFVLLVACCGAVIVLLKYRKLGQPSNAVGPVLSPSLNKRSGMGSILSTGPASSPNASVLTTMPATITISVKMFSLTELKRATDKFSSKKILGEGGFGRVYHGVVEDGSDVAVKLLTRNQQHGDREFISEVEMLSRLHHRNLVKLIGICIEDNTRCLVYELVSNGSVESHLHEKKNGSLDWDARLKIALGAARGLAYLHEDSNPRVIHRDFKASNVLLEDDFTPKVSDFGLAREATEGSHHISTRVMGTFGYVAPEYAMTGHLLVKSDVYSYGVVLLELLSGRKPVDMSQPPGQENLVTWARPLFSTREGLEELVDPSLESGTYDFDDMAKVAAIASMCVHPEVTERPFMGEVVQALKLIYKDTDETCGDGYSQRESSVPDSDKGDFAPSDSSWWNAVEGTPRLVHGHASTFITMDYSSGPLEDMEENRHISVSSLVGGATLPVGDGNRSGPLRTGWSKKAFYRLKGSMSEHGLLSKRAWDGGYEASF